MKTVTKLLDPNINLLVLLLFIMFNLLIVGKSIEGAEQKIAGFTEVSGVISENATWDKAESPYYITGNILVDRDVILSISKGTEVIFQGDFYIEVRGKLIAGGTEEEPIIIDFDKERNASGTSVNGLMIKFVSDYNILKNCKIKNGVYGLHFDGSSYNELISCVFINNDGIPGYGQGIQMSQGSSYNKIINCTFDSTELTVFGDIKTTRDNEIRGSVFKNNSRTALQIISQNNIIDDCTFVNNGTGIYFDRAYNNILTNSLFEDNIVGIEITGRYSGNNQKVEYCVVKNNSTGLLFCSAYDNTLHTVRYNNIFDNVYNVSTNRYSGEYTIDLSYNYWGTTNEEEIKNKIYDFHNDFSLAKVNYKPFLSNEFSKVMRATGVFLDPLTLKLTEGETFMLTATVQPTDATDKGVSWSSSNPSVAIVSDGLVKAISVGKATITVTTDDGDHTATCSVSVDTLYNLGQATNPITGGSATDLTGTGAYIAGATVTIKAEANEGYEFSGWSAPSGTFANVNATETTFIMPAQNVTVTANFTAVTPPLMGDVDGDGNITVTDAIMVLRQIVGLIELNTDQLMRAKVSGRDDLTVSDAIQILRHIVGLIEDFSVEKEESF